jgi:hypothetical protein
MKKQFIRFSAIVPIDFNEKMIEFWMRDEGLSRSEAINIYHDGLFIDLVNRIKGKRCNFKPDLGYSDKDLNGSLCFEVEDNNFCIPVSILN